MNKGLVFSMRQYLGSAEPPATVLEDESRFGSDGAFRADGQPDWVLTPKGIWVLDFNPANPDYIEIAADQTQLNFTSGDFSLIMRVRVDAFGAGLRLFTRGLLDTDGYDSWLGATADQRLNFATAQAATTQISRTAALAINTWYTLGISRSGASVRLYVNGVDATVTVDVHINPETSSRSAKIGVYDDLTTAPYDGKIAYLEVYNYALSAEQHAAMHNRLEQWG